MTVKTWSDTWDDFFNSARDKRIVIWGGGDRCKRILPYLNRLVSVNYIVDSDTNKWGYEICGVRIESPSYFFDTEDLDNCVVLICGYRIQEIAEVLENHGFLNFYSEFYMENTNLHLTRSDICPKEKIRELDSILCDEESRRILKAIVDKRMFGRIEYDDICSDGDEYFRNEFFSFENDEVLIDGGAYDGDTICSFAQNHEFKKIIAFEPDETNYILLKKSLPIQLFKNKIECRNEGLSDRAETCFFWASGTVSSYIGNEVDNSGLYERKSIKCIPIDGLVDSRDISFIKMDIEGSEIKAIHGAKQTIQMNKPKLAICIYHKPDDLWEIPMLIHEIMPEYKLYIRHFGMGWTDTILYASL